MSAVQERQQAMRMLLAEVALEVRPGTKLDGCTAVPSRARVAS